MGHAPVFGGKCFGSFATFDPASWSWRTSQLSLFQAEGSMKFLDRWTRAGSIVNGIAYRHQPLAPLTAATASGLLPTPRGEDSQSCGGHGNKIDSLTAFTKLLPTPTADSSTERLNKYKQGGTPLTAAYRTWPTPKASPSGPDFAKATRPGTGGDDLPTAVARTMLPTPTASRTGDYTIDGKTGKKRASLQGVAKQMVPTPDANCHKGGNRKGQLTDPSCGVTPDGGQLNPTWVEWLMGYPLGWTDLEA